jgi:N-methylhydantoinase A
MLLGVDVGGTFTDAVAASPTGDLYTAKTLTTPADESVGVIRAIELALDAAGATAAEISAFAHGTTVTTNALLEGRAARTALVATEGFTDLVELGRQARADLYRLCVPHPPALVPAPLRFAVDERTGPHGPLRSPAGLEELASALAGAAVEAIAVVLLHASAHPGHELEVRDALRRRLPDVHISLSHEVSATPREYERGATTELDAALSPLLRGHLSNLADRCTQAGLPHAAVMQSSGGLTSAARAAAHGALTVLSGPAGGVQGARMVAAAAGARDVLCFDMGGTSTDVCAIDQGEVRETDRRTIAGRPLALPSLDIETVGAGGGSIGWRDAGGVLRVGPRSSGARPGPAAYGRGGGEPTVTDAHLVLGHLPRDGVLAGGVRLDHELALAAIGRLADELGVEPLRAAEGIVEVANAEMLRAMRAVTVARGIDPRDYTLMAFGGAGPLHATAIAAALGIRRIFCPRACGVLSALGLAAAAPRRDATGSFEAAAVGPLRARARAELGSDPCDERVRYALRYRGQSFELTVDAPPDADAGLLRARFEEAHERAYGYREAASEVELVTVTVSVWGEAPSFVARAARSRTVRTSTRIRLDGRELEATLITGEPAPDDRIEAPAVCALTDATLLVTPGWAGLVLADGTIELTRA